MPLKNRECTLKKRFVSFLLIFLSFFFHFQEYKVYGYFHQNWSDPRLAGKFNRTITLTGSDIDNFWVPDPFCYNARESNMMTPNEEVHSKLHISTNGDIKMSKGWVYSHIKRRVPQNLGTVFESWTYNYEILIVHSRILSLKYPG